MAKLKDIMEITGYSLSTISRVLSKDPTLKVPDETVIAIVKCAEEIGYVPKRKNRNKKIAIITWEERQMQMEDAVYFYMQVGSLEKAKRLNVTTSVMYREDTLLNVNDVDGIIAIGKFSERQLKLMSRYSNKIIFIDSNPDPFKYDSIQTDYKKLIEKSINIFINKGITEIGFIGGKEIIEDGTTVIDQQKHYFSEIMDEYGYLNKSIVEHGKFGLETGSEIVNKWHRMGKIPKAIVCSNDFIAIGAISELVTLGYKVDEDVEIIGCNDYNLCSYINPTVSSVDIPFRKMGEMAVELLIKRIEGDNSPNKVHFVEPRHISRESCVFEE